MLGGAFAPAAPACGGERLEKRAAKLAVIPPVQIQNKIHMIRIAFETRTNSEDPHRPNAWRREAAAKLREIAKRITAGEPMPLILFDRDGNYIGKARELSYRPEPPRELAANPPPFIGGEKHSFSDT